MFDLSEIFR